MPRTARLVCSSKKFFFSSFFSILCWKRVAISSLVERHKQATFAFSAAAALFCIGDLLQREKQLGNNGKMVCCRHPHNFFSYAIEPFFFDAEFIDIYDGSTHSRQIHALAQPKREKQRTESSRRTFLRKRSRASAALVNS